MKTLRKNTLSPLENLVLYGVFAILCYYSYGLLVLAPYPGFRFEVDSREVASVYLPEAPERDIRVGDVLLRIGDVDLIEYAEDNSLHLYQGVHPGDTVPIQLIRDGETLMVDFVYPGFTLDEFWERFPTQWWLAFAFWLWGLAVMFWVQPRDFRWRLLVAFNFVMAVFWAAGNGVGPWHIGYSIYLVRSLIWLVPALFMHLNWVFPKPLAKLPNWLGVLWYLAFAALGVAQAAGILPNALGPLALVAGLLVSVVFLIIQAFRAEKAERNAARLLAFVSLLAILPAFLAGIAVGFGFLTGMAFAGGLLAIPLLPGVYVYVLARARLGGLEMRATRAVIQFSYLAFTGALAVIAASLLIRGGSEGIWAILFGFFGSVTALALYPRYEQFFQKRFLGMTSLPEDLERGFAARISTSLDQPALVALLQDAILPTLLIRQCALVRKTAAGSWETLTVENLDSEPSFADLEAIQSELGVFRGGDSPVLPWVRLALPLREGPRLTGLWLLGRRDPDDYYNPLEIPFFQHLADQIALALINIEQASQLRALYQGNVDNHERERAGLARELHDDVLNHLASLLPNVQDGKMLTDMQGVIASLRQTVTGLRPTMLTYGLQTGLDELIDILEDRPGMHTAIKFEIPPTDVRFDPTIELHLFRIIQQACENALRHGQPGQLAIRGQIQPAHIQLEVEDNGQGFLLEDHFNVVELMHKGHFGLAGMLERADLLGASLKIDSAPGRGTRIQVDWEPATIRV
ncbi:MAG: hypothetical protein EPO32_11240 [Anaerolineae bacterium]|nr:MAG: hypothetical protein EPO32_11240 [Anaerolineae bacterium]